MNYLCGGYWGRILNIDLSDGKVEVRNFDETFAKKYLGGFGFAAAILSERVAKSTDPLGSENALVLTTGPYQSSAFPGSGRAVLAAKSPLSGVWGGSSAGGRLGPQLKRAGYDAVVVAGKSEKPVYLLITDERVEIKGADKLWGLDAVEVHEALSRLEDKIKPSIAVIGPGAERLVRYACIVNDHHGFFGRCGLGAVMGAKNLKAIAVSGSLEPPISHPEKVKELAAQLKKMIAASEGAKYFRQHGQAAAVESREQNGLLPLKNFALGNWDKVGGISVPRLTEELEHKPWACPHCVLGCHRRVTHPKHADLKTGGLEYETIGMIGSNLLIDNPHDLARANEVLNRYTLDTIDAGGVIAWAYESFENKILTKADTDGLELTWGNSKALVALCGKIGRREGIGDLLAEGLRACVKAYPESKEFAVEAMGMAIPAHDPRAFFGQVITSIASTRGPCHLNALGEANELGVAVPEMGLEEVTDRFSNENKGKVSSVFQDVGQLWNSLCFCLCYYFEGFQLEKQKDLLNHITGWNTTVKDLAFTAERITCLQQMFNLEMGFDPLAENVMPARLEKPRPTGEAAGKVPDWKHILHDYWKFRGWGDNGRPSNMKLKELGLISNGPGK